MEHRIKPPIKAVRWISDFLADNIAQSSDTAFIAGKTEDLMKVFEAISESVVSGITGENLTVTDGFCSICYSEQLANNNSAR